MIYDMSIVYLLSVHKWAPSNKHVKGIYVILRGVTVLVNVFIILLKIIHLIIFI